MFETLNVQNRARCYRSGDWFWLEQVDKAIRAAYVENVGHEPPESPDAETSAQFTYLLPMNAGGSRPVPKKADRPIMAAHLASLRTG